MKSLIAAITAVGVVASFSIPAVAQGSGSGSGTSVAKPAKKAPAKKAPAKKTPSAGSGSGSR
jgi:hypothetical protein